MSTAKLLSTTAAKLSTTVIEDEGFYDLPFVCRYYGGNKPVHPATIWRGVKAGRIPKPKEPSPNVRRWLGRELRESKEVIISGSGTAA
jgi:hypothetical protein